MLSALLNKTFPFLSCSHLYVCHHQCLCTYVPPCTVLTCMFAISVCVPTFPPHCSHLYVCHHQCLCTYVPPCTVLTCMFAIISVCVPTFPLHCSHLYVCHHQRLPVGGGDDDCGNRRRCVLSGGRVPAWPPPASLHHWKHKQVIKVLFYLSNSNVISLCLFLILWLLTIYKHLIFT